MKAIGYLIVRAGPRINIHDEEPIAEGFESVAAAQEHIAQHGLTRVQIIATCRRWLTADELFDLDHAIVEERAAA